MVAVVFVALATEPLAYRLMSLVFLGIIPAVTVYAIGSVLSRIMRIAYAVCDFSITLLYPKYLILADTMASVWNLLICFTKDGARRSITTFTGFLHGCRCGLRQTIAAGALCSAITVHLARDACRYFLIVITFAIRLVARILIAVIPQELSAT